MSLTTERKLPIRDTEWLAAIFGNLDEHAKLIERTYDVVLTARDEGLSIVGEPRQIDKAAEVITALLESLERGEEIDDQRLRYTMSSVDEGDSQDLGTLDDSVIVMTHGGKPVKPKTLGQKRYFETIQNHVLTFGIGPAGTGKTYMAVAMAVRAFKNHEVNRIVITRPAVEAGESLGFLPGDLHSKVGPYLRPLHDALYDILGPDTYIKFKERGLVEVAPLAYMRGRTLDDSFIILDEAQNTTKEQMKMFLTRFGFGSKVVVNGDITQIDLPTGRKSGLIHALEVLQHVDEIGVTRLTKRDVVRHNLVRKIIAEYEKSEKKQTTQRSQKERRR